MTKETVENLKLGIAPINDEVVIIVQSGLEWIEENTTFEITDETLKALPANVKLFLIRYFDLMSMRSGISSESIRGLSQSFNTANKSQLIWEYAEELLGPWLKSQMTFVPAKRRW